MNQQNSFSNNYDEKKALSQKQVKSILQSLENNFDMIFEEKRETPVSYKKEIPIFFEPQAEEKGEPFTKPDTYEAYKKQCSGNGKIPSESVEIEIPQNILDELIEISLLLKMSDLEENDDHESFDLSSDFMDNIQSVFPPFSG